MKKIAGWMAAPAAALWAVVANAQEQAQAAAVEPTVSPVWAGVFVALVVGLIVWFAVAMMRSEKARKGEQKSA